MRLKQKAKAEGLIISSLKDVKPPNLLEIYDFNCQIILKML